MYPWEELAPNIKDREESKSEDLELFLGSLLLDRHVFQLDAIMGKE